MTREYEIIKGDVEITSELNMNGMFLGNVTIKDGGYLVLNGMAKKSLVVEYGAVVEIPGMVTGDVINNGGNLSISGMVCGQVIENEGTTNITENASIG
ncbi:hypothetical protein [Salinivibrio kushneri]|uniref:Polymer-forming cytoskeletal protein n=1 Tax=Salinivibrio kushneri TaxID=1908198 RepID=A0AB36K332_9GAMM|nr:hypothetical protein [Salinivibrio kushneri]OOE42695.1 hypothetical protein BZG09_12720 [Salinivibrio kushneri]